jgi:hypothetical protein
MKIDITTPLYSPPSVIYAPTTKSWLGPAPATAGHPGGQMNMRSLDDSGRRRGPGQRGLKPRRQAQAKRSPSISGGHLTPFVLGNAAAGACRSSGRLPHSAGARNLSARGSMSSTGAPPAWSKQPCPGRPRARQPWRRQV